MIAIIQCAATKNTEAGRMRLIDGSPVTFVARPSEAPARDGYRYARPDDISDRGKTWRQLLHEYNRDRKNNPLGLYPAYRLYKNPLYGRLVERCGSRNVYILSAGWGLIGADFLTPYYDITFSQAAEAFKRRHRKDLYLDCNMLLDCPDDDIVFFGSREYVPSLCQLTAAMPNRKNLFYNSARAPVAPGWELEKFETTTRTNWHYECAKAFLGIGGAELRK